jgi:hypothetical protein
MRSETRFIRVSRLTSAIRTLGLCSSVDRRSMTRLLQRPPFLTLTEYETLLAQRWPFDFSLGTERMGCRKRDQYTFCPELGHVAVRNDRLSSDADNIDTSLLHERNVIVRCSLENLDCDTGVTCTVGCDHIAQKSSSHRRQDTDAQMTHGASARHARCLYCIVELEEGAPRLIEEAMASLGHPHASVVSFEQRYPKKIFESANTAADSRLLYAKHRSGAAEAQAIGNGQCLPDRHKVNGNRTQSRRSRGAGS